MYLKSQTKSKLKDIGRYTKNCFVRRNARIQKYIQILYLASICLIDRLILFCNLQSRVWEILLKSCQIFTSITEDHTRFHI